MLGPVGTGGYICNASCGRDFELVRPGPEVPNIGHDLDHPLVRPNAVGPTQGPPALVINEYKTLYQVNNQDLVPP